MAQSEKQELENEIKSRNEEIYQMNEKMIMNEINSSITIGAGGEQQINELQIKVNRLEDGNRKRAHDMNKLKQCLERLRWDLHVLYLSKKLNKDDDSNTMVQEAETMNTQAPNEQSTDSEKIIKDQIQNTLDFITKIEQSLQQEDLVYNGSPDNKLKERRMSAPSSADRKHERRRSHTID